jgi:transcriptional regulator with XRE-family HTH domain
VSRSELARALRAARHDRGFTQSRLSARLGVPVTVLGRWEHGEAVPDADEVRAVAGALSVEPDTVDSWLELRSRVVRPAAGPEPETLTVEILPARVAVAEPPPPPPAEPNGSRRRARERSRRAAQRDGGRERRSRQRAGDEARRLAGRTRQGASDPPVFAPDLLEERSHVIATVNSGTVFPVPGSRRTIERLTYSTGAPTYRVTPEERMVYHSRWMRVVLVMLALAALLWWAVAQLGDGWDAVLDLFRSKESPGTTVGALAFCFLRHPG